SFADVAHQQASMECIPPQRRATFRGGAQGREHQRFRRPFGRRQESSAQTEPAVIAFVTRSRLYRLTDLKLKVRHWNSAQCRNSTNCRFVLSACGAKHCGRKPWLILKAPQKSQVTRFIRC